MPDFITPLIGMGMGILQQGMQDKRQVSQQGRLLKQQLKYDQAMSKFNQGMALDMWHKTGYGPQVKQMKEAGINPALMYGMGGGGGQTAQSPIGSVNSANAPSGGGEIGMGIQQAMQVALLKAQKENIEADTKNKEADTVVKDQQQHGLGFDNALKEYLQSYNTEGEYVGGLEKDTIAAQQASGEVKRTQAETKFKLDENERQQLMNNAVMQEIGAKISLMAKQGQSQEQIYKNLVKEGLLLDAEIEWNKMDIEGGNVGKFITNIIKMAFKPK